MMMVDSTNPTVATVIGVVIGFAFSTISWLIQAALRNRGRKKAVYIRLDGILTRIEAHSGTRQDRQLSEVDLIELERLMSDNADVLDKTTLDKWYSKDLKVVQGSMYKANLDSFTEHVRELSKELCEDC